MYRTWEEDGELQGDVRELEDGESARGVRGGMLPNIFVLSFKIKTCLFFLKIIK